MDEAAKKLHNDLSRFANTLSGEHHVLKESLSKAAQELAEAFDVQPKASVGKIALVRKMQVQRAYYKKKCESLAKQLKDASGVKSHGLLNRMWLVRASLGDPTVAPRSLEQFCREFHDVEVSTISATSIAAGRDCFAELIKLNTGHIIADAVSRMDAATDEASKPVILCHIHDEAALRLRSFDASLGQRLIRARSSKIQNHAMTLQAGMETYEIFTELQPLLKKDGPTLGQALINALQNVLEHIARAQSTSWKEITFFHLLTGDGVNTNQAAARFLLGHCQKIRALGDFTFVYFLVPHVCSSHQANLAVSSAIAAACPESPDLLVANVSRLYRHLLPDYLEEFSAALRRHVETTVRFMKGDPATLVPAANYEHMTSLQKLYGEAVLPREWTDFFNFHIHELCHVADLDKSIEHVRCH